MYVILCPHIITFESAKLGVHGWAVEHINGFLSTVGKCRKKDICIAPNCVYSRPSYTVKCMRHSCNQFSFPRLRPNCQQDWFQCRKWGSTDLSNVLDIGDNFESSVIFIVSGSNWFRNFVFVFLFCLWTAFQFAATLSNSSFSCIWRVNCDNEHVVRSVTSTEPESIKNVYSSTVMPMEFRGILVGLMVANLFLVCAWDYFIVNKMIRKCGRKVASAKGEATISLN